MSEISAAYVLDNLREASVYEQLRDAGFQAAVDNYVVANSELVQFTSPFENKAEPFDCNNWRRDVQSATDLETYDAKAKVIARMSENFALLEQGSSGEMPQAEEPGLTICMPVAIIDEDPKTVLKSLRAFKPAQVKLQKPVEVILWANAADSDGNSEISSEKYDQLQAMIDEADLGGITVRSALQVLPKEQLTISALRRNMMEALTINAQERKYGFDHPVLWADADTTYLSSGAFEKIERSVRSFRALAVHTNLHFSLDWAKDQKLHDLDDAAKAVAAAEFQRRELRRIDSYRLQSEYVEESGLAFALGTYLEAGGVNTVDKMNESFHLMTRMRNAAYFYREWPDGPVTPDRPLIMPLYILDDLEKRHYEGPEPMITLKGAHMGTSARRLHRDVKEHGVKALDAQAGAAPEGVPYELYAGKAGDRTKADVPLLRKDVADRLDAKLIRYTGDADEFGDKKFSTKRQRVIQRLIDSSFED